MSGVIVKELQTVGVAVCSGVLVTFVYDLLRIFRRGIDHGNLWIGIEDFFFWVWTTFWIFSVLYRENDGALRFYTMLSMMVGMIAYHKLVSERFVKIFGRIFKKILGILGYPMKKLKKFTIFLGNKLKMSWKQIIMKCNQNR